MQFGVDIATKIDDWQIVADVEALGYDMAWLADSQMIWSDCYATLALAAHNTSRIRLGTGVAVAPTRLAPVTAHSIASINRLAPGRVFLGLGTGHTSMRIMGMPPMGITKFREYVRVVRALLNGEEVNYAHQGETRAIRFLHRDLNFINIDDRIPIYLAANGPRALQSAGELADGWISGTKPAAAAFERDYALVKSGAEKVGRTLSDEFLTAGNTTAVVLKPGEKLDSDRVIDCCGSQVACVLHFVYEIVKQTGNEAIVPPAFSGIWEEYCAHVEAMATPIEKRYLEIHDGHCTYLRPEERRFVTPKAIHEACLVGEPDDIIEQIRRAEAAGLKQVVLLPPLDSAREVFSDFAKQVIARY
jgi:alkanesulfonate monooxygenase SsuD/methylene tetrahydromethanopterin reductase-like flavin-dependent oxidoreductase (luciferase family)